MKRTLSELVLIDLLFIALMSLSGFFFGVLRDFLYLLSFVVPTLVFLSLRKNRNEEAFGISFSLKPPSFSFFILFVAPTVLGIMALSFISSLLMGVIGVNAAIGSENTNLIYAIVIHAIAPAIFEEMLFRYIPIRSLANHSPRLAVIYSAVLFSLSHCNLFQIPYALFAGVVFAALDIAAGSIMPSVLIHLINNVLSLVWERGAGGSAFYILFISLLALLTLVSILLIYLKRKKLKEDFSSILEDKSKFIFTNTLGFYMIATLAFAVTSLSISF